MGYKNIFCLFLMAFSMMGFAMQPSAAQTVVTEAAATSDKRPLRFGVPEVAVKGLVTEINGMKERRRPFAWSTGKPYLYDRQITTFSYRINMDRRALLDEIGPLKFGMEDECFGSLLYYANQRELTINEFKEFFRLCEDLGFDEATQNWAEKHPLPAGWVERHSLRRKFYCRDATDADFTPDSEVPASVPATATENSTNLTDVPAPSAQPNTNTPATTLPEVPVVKTEKWLGHFKNNIGWYALGAGIVAVVGIATAVLCFYGKRQQKKDEAQA